MLPGCGAGVHPWPPWCMPPCHTRRTSWDLWYHALCCLWCSRCLPGRSPRGRHTRRSHAPDRGSSRGPGAEGAGLWEGSGEPTEARVQHASCGSVTMCHPRGGELGCNKDGPLRNGPTVRQVPSITAVPSMPPPRPPSRPTPFPHLPWAHPAGARPHRPRHRRGGLHPAAGGEARPVHPRDPCPLAPRERPRVPPSRPPSGPGGCTCALLAKGKRGRGGRLVRDARAWPCQNDSADPRRPRTILHNPVCRLIHAWTCHWHREHTRVSGLARLGRVGKHESPPQSPRIEHLTS
jgi:hypothetical protein